MGTIPQFSGELRQLHLDHNGLLEGPLPEILAPLLEELRLEHNSLSETIPTTYSNGNLSLLYLDNNFLTGTIPKELGNLTKLVTLKLGNNLFHGSVPDEICMLRQSFELKNFTAINCFEDSENNHDRIKRQRYSFAFRSGDNTNLRCNCCDPC